MTDINRILKLMALEHKAYFINKAIIADINDANNERQRGT